MSDDELTKIGTEKEAAEKFVKKHVVPGTLFTAGMRFYQVKESMADGQSVTLQKNGGKKKRAIIGSKGKYPAGKPLFG